MKIPTAPLFWDALLWKAGLVNLGVAWAGMGAAVGLVALTVEDALRRRKR